MLKDIAQTKHINLLNILISVSLLSISSSLLYAETFSTSFEGQSGVPDTLGTGNLTATFSGGNAQTVGIGAYYQSGLYSWHIPASMEGEIQLETPASNIQLWFRNTVGAGPSMVTVFGVDNEILFETAGTQTFQLIDVTPTGNQSLVKRIIIDNNGSNGDVVVDDFSFIAESAPDDDNDGIPNDDDNCPAVLNSDQTNSDNDSFGDACDEDDDNDGLSDIEELDLGRNPKINEAVIIQILNSAED